MNKNDVLTDPKKLVTSFVIVIVFLLCLFFIRVRNGTQVRATVDYAMSEKVVLYRQDDEKWADDKLGNSTYSMAGSGCLVCCIASAISDAENMITPGELNKLFSENGVYDTEGNIQWGQISEMDEFEVEVFSSPSNEIIEKCLADGKYPIVRVRIKGLGNFHYVLIVGTEEGKYVCMDPLEDALTTLSDYGNRVYAIRCVWKESV